MKAYAIKDQNGDFYEDSIRENESQCIYDFKKQYGLSEYLFEAHGYRCVPVEIKEIKPKEKCKHLNTRTGHSPFVACICNDCNEEI